MHSAKAGKETPSDGRFLLDIRCRLISIRYDICYDTDSDGRRTASFTNYCYHYWWRDNVFKGEKVMQRKIILDKSIPNCYNMYMKKRWNVAKELERIAERKRKWKQFDWVFLLKHPLTWLLLMLFITYIGEALS